MKRIITITALAVALTACGALEDLQNALQDRVQAGQLVATGRDLSKDLAEIKKLSGGIQAFVPKLDEGKGGLNFAPGARLAPGLAPSGDACTTTFPLTTTTVVQTSYPAEAEEAESEINIRLRCDVVGEDPIVAWVDAKITYKDGSTGTTSLYEIDSATDIPDDDVVNGFSELKLARYFGEDDPRVSVRFVAEVDLQGSWDESSNLWRYGWHEVVMRNGAEITAEIRPDAPVLDGEDMTSGSASRIMVHASGNVTRTTENAVITGENTGTFTKTIDYKDGKSGLFEVTSDGVTVTVHAEGREGFVRDGSLNLQTGEYEIVTDFPAGHFIDVVTESGTWRKDSTGGTYTRVIDFTGGRQARTDAEVAVAGNTLDATFSHQYDTADLNTRIEGEIEIVETPSLKKVDITITNAAGDTATLKGKEYPDGTAMIDYTKDRKATADNPDEKGTFSFEADGSASGTVTVSTNGVETEYTVTINADGSGEVKDDAGKVIATF